MPTRSCMTIIAAVYLLFIIPYGDCVRCFCTEDHCAYGVCTAEWCLVGIKQAGAVIRTCGNDAAALLKVCRKDVSDWSEVCACNSPFCNTFAFLRQQIAYNRFGPQPNDEPPSASEMLSPMDPGVAVQPASPTKFGPPNVDTDSDYRTFNRVDVPYDNSATKDKDQGHRRRRVNKQSSYLIIVLILVPLSVGSCAVLLVAVNYYCNLC